MTLSLNSSTKPLIFTKAQNEVEDMPTFPKFADRVHQITGSVFETYRAKIAAQGDNLVKLHIGDTYLPPNYPLPIDADILREHADFNRYCNTFGIEPLRAALTDKLRSDNDLAVTADNILISSGATNGLSVSVMALVDPGDDVMILTPAWPFFFGMVQVAGGNIIEVPFYTRLFSDPELDVESYLAEFITDRTVALYINTPNNPSAKVLSREQLHQISQFVRAHDLWVISDEAYDGLTFDGRPHISIATLPEMFDRTLAMFTFSKSFMFAGLRLGYVVGEVQAIQNCNKMMVHQLYSPSTLAQYMMVKPVQTRHDWLPSVQRQVQDMRDLLVQNLAIDFSNPEGTCFVFFPAEPYLNGRDYWQLIEACLDAGVSVAPGDSFGQDYHDYIRLCFTGESPERLRTGIQRLNNVFGC